MSEMTISNKKIVRFELPDKGGESSKVDTMEESPPVSNVPAGSKDQEDEMLSSTHLSASILQDALGGPSPVPNSPPAAGGSSVFGSTPFAHPPAPLVEEKAKPDNENSEKDSGKSSNDAFLEMLQVLFCEFFEVKPNSTSNYNTKEIQDSIRKKFKLFGLAKGLSTPATRSNDRYDYEQKYPRDQHGKELAENARAWLTYLDEADAYDRDRVEGWKETVDILLVFAGLFSGVITTFVSQASQSLQQNYSQISASLLFQMSQVQLAQFTGTPITINPNSTLTPNSPFRPSMNAFLVNGLWFISLAISLSTALIAVLTKQWLYYYMSAISGTAREKARVRHFRFQGLELWKVSLIIDLLPILLHLALGVFLIGVIIFLFPLDTRIAWAIIVISGITYMLYFISVMLPVRYPDCPYTTSLTIYIGNILYLLLPIFEHAGPKAKDKYRESILSRKVLLYRKRISYWSCTFRQRISFPVWRRLQYPCSHVRGTFSKLVTWLGRIRQNSQQYISTRDFTSWRQNKLNKAIEKGAVSLDCKALYWLYTISSNPSVRRISARGISVHPDPTQETVSNFWYLRNVLSDETDGKDQCCRLCLDLHLGFIDRKLGPISLSISSRDEMEYQSYSRFSGMRHKTYVRILEAAFKDSTLKFPLVVWRWCFSRASKDVTLTAHILSSYEIFDWSCDPAGDPTYKTGVVPVGTQEQQKWMFDYLFRCFCENNKPDYSHGSGSFETCYLLLVTVYRNLTSDKAIIVDEEQREKSLQNLFRGFYLPIGSLQKYISSKHFVTFLEDIISVNAFWKEPMTNRARRAAIDCLDNIWRWTDTDMTTVFHSTKCLGLTPIIRWCSQIRPSRALMALLLMPQNHASLSTLLTSDPDATSHFSNCLKNIRRRGGKVDVMYPNLMDLFRSADLTSPLFDDSVLLQAWMFFVSDFVPKELFLILKSKLKQERLENLHAVMVKEAKSGEEPSDIDIYHPFQPEEQYQTYVDRLHASLVEFGRIIGATQPRVESTAENPASVNEDADDDTEACRGEPSESEGTSSRSMATRLTKALESVWPKTIEK